MRTLTIRGVPEELHEELKDRAERNRRSLNGETLVLLERALRFVPEEAVVMERIHDVERSRHDERPDFGQASAERAATEQAAVEPDREAVLGQLRSFRAALRELGVRRIGLFGSLARGEGHPESDIDLLVEFDPARKDFATFYRLSCFLDELLGREVELVTTEGLSAHLAPRIHGEAEFVEVES